ncbi:MAG: cryptochrome/photolyase family protein [Planktomarina sp.]|nr:cryptochrome/photolyase family protein [Planktomarina sp.]MDT2039788.1 cryptochrome/photolyase family protein [Planktomarina sp.]
MPALRIILGDQLSNEISSLSGINAEEDIVLICEVFAEATYVKHHKKKIVFLFSAMRHFAEELRVEKNYQVEYLKLNDPEPMQSFTQAVEKTLAKHKIDEIIVTSPGEYRVLTEINIWQDLFGIPVDIREDARFLCNQVEFKNWSKDRKNLRMEYFYREMRKKYSILMDGDQPIGGKWNFDLENRKPPNPNFDIPETFSSEPDAVTLDVMQLVEDKFSDHMGVLSDFHFAINAAQAKIALKQFIDERLKYFGDFQDAMIQGKPWMYHSHVGLYLNCGLLSPLECIQAAEQAYHDSHAPLNAVEGFIRQILGWREFVRGIYWNEMPDYASLNFFEAERDLPAFYWDADTKMNCMHQSVKETSQNAYAHHIQRLMVLGNFALLTGIDPVQVNAWFLSVYADAFEWVELPNVSGMALFADGGYLASKPYAAGGGYINKMSNYCKSCSYSVTKKSGPDACPFNYLYWDFLERNRNKLGNNHRIGMMYKVYDRMSEEKKEMIKGDSNEFLISLDDKTNSRLI